MKRITVSILATLISINGVMAESPLLKSLRLNIYQARSALKKESQRLADAKESYEASKAKLAKAEKRLISARQDELEEDRQIRAIAKANARYYEIPDYQYSSGSGTLRYGRLR